MPDEPFLTSPEVAARLRRSVRTVHRLALAGDLPYALKLPGPNGAFLFHPNVVDEYQNRRAAA